MFSKHVRLNESLKEFKYNKLLKYMFVLSKLEVLLDEPGFQIDFSGKK